MPSCPQCPHLPNGKEALILLPSWVATRMTQGEACVSGGSGAVQWVGYPWDRGVVPGREAVASWGLDKCIPLSGPQFPHT